MKQYSECSEIFHFNNSGKEEMCSGRCQRFTFHSSEKKQVSEPSQGFHSVSNTVEMGSDFGQRFHFNNSGFKQWRECSQRFHWNSNEVK